MPAEVSNALPRRKSLIKRSRAILFIPSNKRKFWSKVEKTETCWLWRGAITTRGYGQFSSDDLHILAHIYAYTVTSGPVSKGLHLHHRCEVHNCVNPSHLTPKTCAEHHAHHAKKRQALAFIEAGCEHLLSDAERSALLEDTL